MCLHLEQNPNRKKCWELSLTEEDTTITAPNTNFSASIPEMLITGQVFNGNKALKVPEEIQIWAKRREDNYFSQTMNSSHTGLTKELKKVINW